MKPTQGDLDDLVRHVQGRESSKKEQARERRNISDWKDTEPEMYRDLKSRFNKDQKQKRKERKQHFEAYYGGEEQRKKDDKKKKIDTFMDKAMPKRTFDQFGRELNRRTGKVLEGFKPFPSDKVKRKVHALDAEKAMGMGSPKKDKRRMKMDMAVYVDNDPELRGMHRSAKQTIEKENRERGRKKMEEGWLAEGRKPKPLGNMVAKALELDMRAEKEKDKDKAEKLRDRARIIQMNAYEQLDALITDPLEALWDLSEEMNVVPKPQLQSDFSQVQGPNTGNFEHPVAMKRMAMDAEMHQGSNPIDAHTQIHGDVDLGDTTSKRQLAGSLGRVQDETQKNGITLEIEKGSILSRDAQIEKQMNQTTHDDLRTPVRGQVPDKLQTPADEVAEEVDTSDTYDYNEDVAYLQKFGRA